MPYYKGKVEVVDRLDEEDPDSPDRVSDEEKSLVTTYSKSVTTALAAKMAGRVAYPLEFRPEIQGSRCWYMTDKFGVPTRALVWSEEPIPDTVLARGWTKVADDDRTTLSEFGVK